MAMHGQIPVQFGAVFPDGAYAAGAIEMVRDFNRSTADRPVQQADKETGLPLWVVEVIDAHDGFEIITSRIRTRRLTGLLWLVAWMSFILSAVLDNLTEREAGGLRG